MRRFPWGVALVVCNVGLGAALIKRRMSREAAPVQAAEFSLSGEVSVKPGLTWPRGAVLFVAARPEAGGPPYAARRFEGPGPVSLGSGDLMIEGAPLPEKLLVTARADQDGDAMTRQPGDLEMSAPAAAAPNAVLTLLLDKKR